MVPILREGFSGGRGRDSETPLSSLHTEDRIGSKHQRRGEEEKEQKMKNKGKRKAKAVVELENLEQLNLNAAGLDIGMESTGV